MSFLKPITIVQDSLPPKDYLGILESIKVTFVPTEELFPNWCCGRQILEKHLSSPISISFDKIYNSAYIGTPWLSDIQASMLPWEFDLLIHRLEPTNQFLFDVIGKNTLEKYLNQQATKHTFHCLNQEIYNAEQSLVAAGGPSFSEIYSHILGAKYSIRMQPRQIRRQDFYS